MFGDGSSRTTITASSSGYNTLTIGPGGPQFVGGSGSLKAIALKGYPANQVRSGISCLQLNGVVQYRCDDVTLADNDIGLDLINNNYGSQFSNLRAGFGGSVNVGINLRTGSESGSDLGFANAWVSGNLAGVQMSPGGGGYHFWGGQINCGAKLDAINDDAGAIVMGRDYLSGKMGECNADFHGTSFEGVRYAHIFRVFDQVNLSLFSASVNPSSSSAPAIDFFRGTNIKGSRILAINVALTGYFSGPYLVSAAGAYSGTFWREIDTYNAANAVTIGGVKGGVASMAAQSGIPNAVVI
jgi:hypothetical protein